jgi:hypothetical protein
MIYRPREGFICDMLFKFHVCLDEAALETSLWKKNDRSLTIEFELPNEIPISASKYATSPELLAGKGLAGLGLLTEYSGALCVSHRK